ncbi:MAG: T9SS type A sorting domain-containing protein [Balneolales bacterium]
MSQSDQALQMKKNMMDRVTSGTFMSRARVMNDEYGLTLREQFTWEAESWVPSTRTEVSYEQDGRSQVIYYSAQDDDLVPVEQVFYDYQGNTMMRTEEHYDFIQQEFIPESRNTYTYADNSNLHNQLLFELWNGNEWQPDERETITFTNGTIDAILIERWMTDEWENDYRHLLSEEDGSVIEITQLWVDGEWHNQYRYVQDETSLSEYMDYFESYIDELDFQIQDFFVSFFESSQLYTTYVWDGEEWQNEERYIRDTANAEEGQAILLYESWEEEAWIAEDRLVVSHNDNDLAQNLELQNFSNGIWFTVYLENYTYNEQNLLATIEQQVNTGTGFQNTTRLVNTWELVPTSTEEDIALPLAHKLDHAYPNPFNPTTVIPYEMSTSDHVSIRLYDVAGRLVSTLYDGVQAAGLHQVTFHANGLASGKYIIRMETGDFSASQAVTLIK